MSSPKQRKHIRVMIVDDHDVVRKSIVAMLDREPGIDVVGSAVNGREAIAVAQTLEPDVIVMDISMPELDGIRATAEIMALDISIEVVLLSMHYGSTLVQQARKSGAAGYVLKQNANKELIPAIRAADAGRISG